LSERKTRARKPKVVPGRAEQTPRSAPAKVPAPIAGEIALRAYLIYLSRGSGENSEAEAEEDWIRAERELGIERPRR